MPRPLTKEDKLLYEPYYKVKRDKVLGLYIHDLHDDKFPYAYQISGDGNIQWITAQTFKRRQKLGHPKPRKKPIKQMLREPDFGLDEMALAEAIINGG